MDIQLHGKIALVTGASGGLGRAMVLTLARCGADIAIHDHQAREQALHLQAQLAHMG